MEASYVVRRSQDSDQQEVTELDYPSVDARKSFFGRVLVGAVVETSFLSLTATEPDRPDRVLGFAAFDSSPPGELADAGAADVHEYLQYKYNLSDVRAAAL
jgi:hypothetical protein